MNEIDEIRAVFAAGLYHYTLHAVQRTTVRRISRQEIEQAVAVGEIIEQYPHDKYGPSCLILGFTPVERPLHVQCSLPPDVKIITAYEPDPSEWLNNRVRR